VKYIVELYEKADGKIPVLEFILGLNPKQQAKIYREIDLLEKFGNELHYPHVDIIKGKRYVDLWELRIELSSNIFRIFYFLPENNKVVLLHGIVKKKQKTPKKELDTALERMKEYIRREKNELE
jgi:phage-related protein